MTRNRTTVGLLLLIILAFGLRIGYCAVRGTLGRSPATDYREYVVAGQCLLQHGTLVSPLIVADVDRTPSPLMPPVYVGLVAMVYALCGVETFAATLVLHLINAAATSLTVLLVFLVASSLGGSRAAWIAGLIATINPTLIGYTDLIWDTSLFTLGVAVSVWMSLRMTVPPSTVHPSVPSPFKGGSYGQDSKTAFTPHPALSSCGERGSSVRRCRSWFAMGLWLGALALLNPALTIAYPFLVLWPLWRRKAWSIGELLQPVAVTVAGWLVAIMPWTIRNYAQFDELMYVRGGFPIELWLGVCPEADAHGAAVYTAQFPLNNDEVQRHVASIGERAFIRECDERARAAIAADPWRFVRLILIRIVDYWTGSAFSHAAPDAGGTPASMLRAGVMYFLIAETALGFLALLINRGLGRDLPWLLAIVICFSAVYCLTHVQVRFRAPMEPVMAVLVGVLALRAFTRVCPTKEHNV